MPNLASYVKIYGKREGKRRFKVYYKKYRKNPKNKKRINEGQRARYKALKTAAGRI